MRRSWTSGRLAIVAAMLCALAASGCAIPRSSGIDPTGERLFAASPPVAAPPALVAAPPPVAVSPALVAAPPPPNVGRPNEAYFDQPLGPLPWEDAAVHLHPHETVAPVGSEVVLIAGVCGADGYLRTNRRLEWSIDPGSVGQFVAVGETGLVDLLLGDFNRPRKITNSFAIGSTLRGNTRLNRGTCNPESNVYVLRGQGWISITSPVEGTSHVTVFAPEVYRWDARIRAAMIHWVDAQWRFPPPAINPAGSRHVFTTTVMRQSNQTPCERWRVRYEIVGGPPAGFAPDGATAVEVPTDPAGQASVEIFEKEPKQGTNKICIQVIRPGDLPGANGQRLVVGTGTTMKTWTGADLSVKQTGPPVGNPGATLTYRIDVCNPGDLPAKDVVATENVPDGVAYVGSNPPAETAGRQLRWRLGELGPRQRRTIEVSLRAEKPGSVANCCEVTAAGGLKAADCATTTITMASLDVRISGPAQAAVGSQAAFQITVTNLSQTPATKLHIQDRLDPGLEHPAVNRDNVIEQRELLDLAAGTSQRINVTVRVAKAGRLCQTVEVTGRDIAMATAQACVMGVGGGAPGQAAPGVAPPPGGAQQPKTPAAPATPTLVVKKSCSSKQFVVGETARFTIEITNTGSAELRNLKVLDRYDAALLPTLATDGYRIEGGGLAWTVDSLPAGKATQLGVHCTCQTAAANACNRVTVTTADGAKVEAEACAEIRAAVAPPAVTPPTPSGTTPGGPTTSGPTLTVIGLGNPVAAGKELTYKIQVENKGTTPCRQITVTATVPSGMLPDPLGTIGPESIKPAIDGQVIRFDPVAELAAGGVLVYRVRVQTKDPGQFKFHVEVTTSGSSQPLVKEASTEVFK
jgi:uncharacterized repeat protein (TIGR01451 family)